MDEALRSVLFGSIRFLSLLKWLLEGSRTSRSDLSTSLFSDKLVNALYSSFTGMVSELQAIKTHHGVLDEIRGRNK